MVNNVRMRERAAPGHNTTWTAVPPEQRRLDDALRRATERRSGGRLTIIGGEIVHVPEHLRPQGPQTTPDDGTDTQDAQATQVTDDK